MATDAPNWVDYLTLVAAALAAGGPLVQIWDGLRKEKEKIDLSLQWGLAPDSSGAPDQFPFLHIHNRSSHDVFVNEVFCARRPFMRKRCYGTALDYEDPFFDLSFPYEVKCGEMIRLRLQENMAARELAKVGVTKFFGSWFKRSSVWIGLTTSAGTQKMIGAESIIPWKNRPAWTKHEG
jgi:hypothetical protein